jgi:DNA repair exonuclease SbcCD ATPase subunit
MTPLRRFADRKLQDYRHAARTAKEEKARLVAAKHSAATAREARDALQKIAQAVQQQAHEQVAKVVAQCLKAVFGEGAYEFRIEFERKRGKTEARLLFYHQGNVLSPTGAAGGGHVDVAAFGLRLACLLLAVPRRRKLLVLDEPFRMVSRNHAVRVRELLETVSRELGVQVVQVTHDPELVAGKAVEFR